MIHWKKSTILKTQRRLFSVICVWKQLHSDARASTSKREIASTRWWQAADGPRWTMVSSGWPRQKHSQRQLCFCRAASRAGTAPGTQLSRMKTRALKNSRCSCKKKKSLFSSGCSLSPFMVVKSKTNPTARQSKLKSQLSFRTDASCSSLYAFFFVLVEG